MYTEKVENYKGFAGINEYASFHSRLNFLGSLRKRKRVMAGKDPNGKNQMEPGAGKKITECN